MLGLSGPRRFTTVVNTPSAVQVVRQHLPSQQLALRFNIDATRRGNAARFINHRCGDPNTQLVIVWASGALLPVVAVVARWDICKGDEITMSYGEEVDIKHADGHQAAGEEEEGSFIAQTCLCSSSYCKGFLPMRLPMSTVPQTGNFNKDM